MEKTIFEMVIEGAKAEGKRIREAVVASGQDRPIEARPGENERFWLEIDLRDGEVNLTNSWGNGTPVWIWEGDGLRFELGANVSQLALAVLLEEQLEQIASAEGRIENSLSSDGIDAALADLGSYHVMEPEEWFQPTLPTGLETDEELSELASVREDNSSGYEIPVYLAFTEAEALEWLTERRDEARDELEAA